ncbi:MAG: nitroreductase family protein [Clostridia bacterium]|nr:nitroreductase family protein [Clostridia bacterium]
MIKVDKTLCTQCGLCIKVCPFTVLEMRKDLPFMIENKEQRCLLCMHCTSVCPVNAICFEDIPKDTEKSMLPASNVYEDLKNLISSNRSIRNFSDKPVPLYEIKDVLKATDYAPSAKNQHPNQWILVHDSKKVDEIMSLVLEHVRETNISKEIISEYERGNNIVTLGAPHLLFGIAPKEGVVNPYTDTTIALTDVDLLLHAKSIGSCWAGYLTRTTNANPKIRALIGLEDAMQVYGILAFGYPKGEIYQRLPHRKHAELFVI